jgi:hypothetical protein
MMVSFLQNRVPSETLLSNQPWDRWRFSNSTSLHFLYWKRAPILLNHLQLKHLLSYCERTCRIDNFCFSDDYFHMRILFFNSEFRNEFVYFMNRMIAVSIERRGAKITNHFQIWLSILFVCKVSKKELIESVVL